MKKIKKLLHKSLGLYVLAGYTTTSLVSTAFAQNNFGTQGGSNGLSATLPGGGDIDLPGAGADQGDGIIGIFKNFINYALGFLALIAFAMLIRGGYKMVASGGDEEAYKEGIKILKNAAIGIAFISVSWFLVTFIFFAIGAVVG